MTNLTETLEHLMRGSSVTETDSPFIKRKEESPACCNADIGVTDESAIGKGDEVSLSSPTYNDGLRIVLDTLDKHKLDIEKALCYARNSMSYNHVCEKVVTGKLIFIPLPNSIMLCEVCVMPNYRLFHCFVAAGDLDELLSIGHVELNNVAASYDCKYISMTGRRGWERPLNKLGWESPLVTMYKEVENELR